MKKARQIKMRVYPPLWASVTLKMFYDDYRYPRRPEAHPYRISFNSAFKKGGHDGPRRCRRAYPEKLVISNICTPSGDDDGDDEDGDNAADDDDDGDDDDDDDDNDDGLVPPLRRHALAEG